jgi:hypothetical protein
MKEKKDQPIKVSTCFEESSSAEMMRRIMSEQGIGSLCEEMMRSLLKEFREDKDEVPAAQKDQGHGKEEQSHKTEV